MKKWIVMTLAAAMVLSMVACSNNTTPTNKPSTEAPSANTTVAPTDAPSTDAATDDATDATDAVTDDATNDSTDDMGAQMVEIFLEETKKGTEVSKILEMISEKIELGNMIESISEGYLPGFSADVTGFKSGTVLAPMISSLPFICYIFEADDTAAMLETLKSLADPRWNICTEAREPIYEVSGNYILFAMIPKPEDL